MKFLHFIFLLLEASEIPKRKGTQFFFGYQLFALNIVAVFENKMNIDLFVVNSQVQDQLMNDG